MARLTPGRGRKSVESDEDGRWAAYGLLLGYSAVSGALLYALLPYPSSLIVHGVLCSIYLGSILLFGPRSSIELGLIPAVLLLIFMAMIGPKFGQLSQAARRGAEAGGARTP